jgi:hypothetical protein
MTTASTAWLRLPADGVGRLPTALAQGRSPYDTALLLREIGYALGGSLGDAFEAGLADEQPAGEGGQLTADAYWQALAAFFRSLGWGELRFRQLHPGVGALEADGWADADGHLSTGILAELLSRTAGSEVAVLSAPTAEADSPRFLFGSAETLQALYENLRHGGTIDAAVGRLG